MPPPPQKKKSTPHVDRNQENRKYGHCPVTKWSKLMTFRGSWPPLLPLQNFEAGATTGYKKYSAKPVQELHGIEMKHQNIICHDFRKTENKLYVCLFFMLQRETHLILCEL